MTDGKSLTRIIVYLAVIILQLIMTQVVTFIVTLFFPTTDEYFLSHGGIFTIVLGMTFSVGVFLAGWLAIQLHWLAISPKLLARFLGAVVGAYIPLIVFLIIYGAFEAGSPVFWFSILGSVLGFYAVGWLENNRP